MKKIAVILLLVMICALPAYAQDATQQTSTVPAVIAPQLFDSAGDSISAQDYDKAALDLSLFILLNPTYSPAYYERAQSYIALNDFDHALADVDQAIATVAGGATPEYGSALYVMRGQLDAQKQDADQALKDYTQAIQIKPTTQALASRALLYLAQDNYQPALADFTDAIKADTTKNPALYIYRGATHVALRDPQAAAADYLSFFGAIQPNPTIHAPIQSGDVVTLQIDQGVVTVLPFAAKARQYISALAVARSGSVDPLMVLIDSQGNPLTGDDNSGGNNNALILNYQVATDGNYGLVVGHSIGGFTGTVLVQFQISDQPVQ